MAYRYEGIHLLASDWVELIKHPVPGITACPHPDNCLEWHFIIENLVGTPFEGGFYHGKLVFDPFFPLVPPVFYMMTPNGRFVCDELLQLELSNNTKGNWGFYWRVSDVLKSILHAFTDGRQSPGTLFTSSYAKQRLAKESLWHNLKNETVKRLFPEQYSTMLSMVAQEGPQQNPSTFSMFWPIDAPSSAEYNPQDPPMVLGKKKTSVESCFQSASVEFSLQAASGDSAQAASFEFSFQTEHDGAPDYPEESFNMKHIIDGIIALLDDDKEAESTKMPTLTASIIQMIMTIKSPKRTWSSQIYQNLVK